ncbi:MAG: hypothetical protein HXX18_12010 [Bacteroidetes bacterium]|nr:hypothetical protein [Bacteroidota bacterium]
MTYHQLESEIRNIFGDSALDDWIIDCKVDVRLKIIAFNIFTDIHLATLNDTDFLVSYIKVEEHLRNSDITRGPIARINGLINSTWDEMWASTKTEIKHTKSFSRILSSDYIKRENANISGALIHRSTAEITDAEVDKHITEFVTHLKNGNIIPFKRGNGIIWIGDTDEIQPITSSFPSSNIARDMMGLYYGINNYLVEFMFKNSSNYELHKPTVFHSEFGPHWRPANTNNGWGVTLNLQDCSIGVAEAVMKPSDWPRSDKQDFNKLGVCNDEISYERWEDYFEHRINEFKLWVGDNYDILNDLEYFLKKLN